MKSGIIIGTYAAVPQVHLQLESWRRFCPGVRLIVSDDASPKRDQLASLCRDYDAEFRSNETRSGHVVGDMQVFLDGIQWATDMGLDMLVKFSRRWIPLTPWIHTAHVLFSESGAPTLSARCIYHRFGFRSEAIAMHVPMWIETDAVHPIREHIEQAKRGNYVLVEAVIHQAAQRAFEARPARCREFETRCPHKPGCGGYIAWPWMKESRVHPRSDVLWHEWARAHEYHRAALQWGIECYSIHDFVDTAANICH